MGRGTAKIVWCYNHNDYYVIYYSRALRILVSSKGKRAKYVFTILHSVSSGNNEWSRRKRLNVN